MLLILFSLLSCLVGVSILVGIKILIGFELTSLSLFFIIPVGSIISGAIMTSGYSLGIKRLNIKPAKKQIKVLIIIAILMFFLVQFGYYQVTYIDDDYSYNYRFKGSHVSEFYFKDTNQEVNFFNFLTDKVNSQSISFSHKRHTIGNVEGNKFVNWLFFALDFFGFLFGGYVVYSAFIESAIYCKKCSKYMKEKELLKIVDNIQEQINNIIEYCDEKTENSSRIMEIIDSNPFERENTSEIFANGILHYCQECHEGYLCFEFYIINEKGKYNHNEESDVKVRLSSNTVSEILNSI
ncbi:hypothetical protein [Halocella sp. SP3-1]|uniref:hypothetical protein n=1 Tax=Halocella sp. SP3-1 TaxID=2382161 RepID=UPI000F750AED|nr:hypothetical protein [Halocella sp. SP3-1]AZO95066.1 hypothetical protein D7D81_10955 [Halocella sp. SP3-1]